MFLFFITLTYLVIPLLSEIQISNVFPISFPGRKYFSCFFGDFHFCVTFQIPYFSQHRNQLQTKFKFYFFTVTNIFNIAIFALKNTKILKFEDLYICASLYLWVLLIFNLFIWKFCFLDLYLIKKFKPFFCDTSNAYKQYY